MYYHDPPNLDVEPNESSFSLRRNIGVLYAYTNIFNIQPVSIPISEIEHNLYIINWTKNYTIHPVEKFELRPIDVIEYIKDSSSNNVKMEEIKSIIDNNIDLSYPIIISNNNDIIDGMHRLIKASILGITSIEAFIINDSVLNEFKSISCKECDSYLNKIIERFIKSFLYDKLTISEFKECDHFDKDILTCVTNNITCNGFKIKMLDMYYFINLPSTIKYLTSTTNFTLDTKIFSVELMFSYINIFKPESYDINIDSLNSNCLNLPMSTRYDMSPNELISSTEDNEINSYINQLDLSYPIIIDKDNNIIDGVLRYVKSKKNKMTSIKGYVFDESLLNKFLINSELMNHFYKLHKTPSYKSIYANIMNDNFIRYSLLTTFYNNFIKDM